MSGWKHLVAEGLVVEKKRLDATLYSLHEVPLGPVRKRNGITFPQTFYPWLRLRLRLCLPSPHGNNFYLGLKPSMLWQ